MAVRVETIDYQGKDYATVPARLKEFRSTNPRASISSEPLPQPDGSMIIKTTIIADRADESSAISTGSARYTEKEMAQKKSYEKLETISVGRALSILGYLNNGEIASTEELDEFYAVRDEKRIAEAVESLLAAETLEDLKRRLIATGDLMRNDEIQAAKDRRKAELSNG